MPTLRMLRDQLTALTDIELDQEAVSHWGTGNQYGARLMKNDWDKGYHIQLWNDYEPEKD